MGTSMNDRLESQAEAVPPNSPPVAAVEGRDARGLRGFLGEIAMFLVIFLVAVGVGLWILPPKARRYWTLVRHETDLAIRNAEIQRQIRQLDAACFSLVTYWFLMKPKFFLQRSPQ